MKTNCSGSCVTCKLEKRVPGNCLSGVSGFKDDFYDRCSAEDMVGKIREVWSDDYILNISDESFKEIAEYGQAVVDTFYERKNKIKNNISCNNAPGIKVRLDETGVDKKISEKMAVVNNLLIGDSNNHVGRALNAIFSGISLYAGYCKNLGNIDIRDFFNYGNIATLRLSGNYSDSGLYLYQDHLYDYLKEIKAKCGDSQTKNIDFSDIIYSIWKDITPYVKIEGLELYKLRFINDYAWFSIFMVSIYEIKLYLADNKHVNEIWLDDTSYLYYDRKTSKLSLYSEKSISDPFKDLANALSAGVFSSLGIKEQSSDINNDNVIIKK